MKRFAVLLIGLSAGGLLGLSILSLLAFDWILQKDLATRFQHRREAGLEVVKAEPERVDQANEGQIVFLTGQLQAETRRDPVLGAQAQALALDRRVEGYQRRQVTRKRTTGRGAGQSHTESSLDWHFRGFEPASRTSPSLDSLNSLRIGTGYDDHLGQPGGPQGVRLGAYELAPALLEPLLEFEPAPLSKVLLQLPQFSTSGPVRRVGDRYLTSMRDESQPQPGDVRIWFETAPLGQVSLVARQRGGRLEPAGTGWIRRGLHHPAEVLSAWQLLRSTEFWRSHLLSLLLLPIPVYLVVLLLGWLDGEFCMPEPLLKGAQRLASMPRNLLFCLLLHASLGAVVWVEHDPTVTAFYVAIGWPMVMGLLRLPPPEREAARSGGRTSCDPEHGGRPEPGTGPGSGAPA
ncbi:MAG: TMEM43 family protein [Vulcanimicrobiota bacterium]